MVGELHEQEEGSGPLLLDLIPHESEWVVKGRGAGDGFGVEHDEKLQLRLGLPGGEDWTSSVRNKRVGDPSCLSLTLFPTMNVIAGAKRGFMDTIQSQPLGCYPHQSVKVEISEQEMGLEKKTCSKQSPNADKNAAGDCHISPFRSGAVPVVGWPPIRSFRKNLTSGSPKSFSSLSTSRSGSMEKEKDLLVNNKSLLVKINMDGIPIGRKVDLMACCSYEKLSIAVDELFRGLLAAQNREPTVGGNHDGSDQCLASTGLLDGSGEYTLVYEDNEGDRMLVGDVPWSMFVSTVKRLRVLKTSELPSLSLGIAGNRRTGVETKS